MLLDASRPPKENVRMRHDTYCTILSVYSLVGKKARYDARKKVVIHVNISDSGMMMDCAVVDHSSLLLLFRRFNSFHR